MPPVTPPTQPGTKLGPLTIVDPTITLKKFELQPEVVAGGRDLSRSVELFDRVNRQDFDACERCQPGMASRAYADGGVLVPSEHHITGFHDWLRTRLTG